MQFYLFNERVQRFERFSSLLETLTRSYGDRFHFSKINTSPIRDTLRHKLEQRVGQVTNISLLFEQSLIESTYNFVMRSKVFEKLWSLILTELTLPWLKVEI